MLPLSFPTHLLLPLGTISVSPQGGANSSEVQVRLEAPGIPQVDGSIPIVAPFPVNSTIGARTETNTSGGAYRTSGVQNNGTPIQETQAGPEINVQTPPCAQPDILASILSRLDEMSDVLKDSTIAVKGGKDVRSRFWATHMRVAEESEGEFLERHNSDMDIVLFFSGLFSAVNTSFIISMGTDLVADPSDTTNALLTQLVQIGLGNLSAPGTTPAVPASTWSPSSIDIWTQAIAYASLSVSLLAAFGAVMGKQWLGYYKASRYGHGSPEDRGRRRQMKMDGLNVWHFEAVVHLFPVLLQFSLLLFGISISADLWYQQRSTAWVVVATVVFGVLFHSFTILASLSSTACPYQTPSSAVLRLCGVDKLLRPAFRWTLSFAQYTRKSVRGFTKICENAIREALYSEALLIALTLASITIWGPPLLLWHLMKAVIFSYIPAIITWLLSLARQPVPKAQDEEANTPKLAVSDITSEHILPLDIPNAPALSLDAPAVKWLLDTSTDPEVFLAAASLVPEIEWPLNLDISDILYQLRNTFMTCFDIQDQLVPRSEERAIICATALNHIYCEILPRSGPRELFDVGPERERFKRLWKGIEPLDPNLSMVSMLGLGRQVFGNDSVVRLLGKLHRCESDAPLVWLSHILPYCILLEEGVTPELADLGIHVIDKLLSSAPSGQIIANCALLACQMLGYKFEWKALARVDKSDAARQISTILAAQFQRLLCPNDSVKRCCPHRFLENTSLGHKFRRIIFDLFHLAPYDARVLKREFIARNLDYCREVYDQARLEEFQASNWDSDIRSILKFVVAAGCQGQIQLDQPDSVWSGQFSWDGDTRSFDDFSWLVDYLDNLHNPDDDEVVAHILLVLSGMRRLGSPTEQHLAYVQSLAFFMGAGHPRHVRHAALRAAHDTRSALASIRISQDGVLLRIATNPSPDEEFFNAKRDLCFLRLVFALARNPNWQQNLVRNDCVQRCVDIIEPSLRCHLHPYYLVGFFFRIAPSEPVITEGQWWQLTKDAWHAAAATNVLLVDDDGVEVLPALVESSRKYLTDGRASKNYLKQLDHHVGSALKMLKRRIQSQRDPSPEKTYTQDVISLVQGLKNVVHEALEQR